MDVKIKNWYKHWFGNEYLTVYSHRDTKEAKQLINLIQTNIQLPRNAKVLDLCCGQGRHANLLAEAGYNVFGIDLSRTLLEIAKFKTAIKGSAYFIQADMRFLPVTHSFDLLLNLFTSFGYFDTDQENAKVFYQFNQALKEKSCFVFDYFNSNHVKESLIPFQKEKIGEIIVEQERYIKNSRIQKKINITEMGNRSIFYESVKMYEPEEIFRMMESAELKVSKIFGDYQGKEFDTYSPRLLVIGEKS